jgi:hypothetical protein
MHKNDENEGERKGRMEGFSTKLSQWLCVDTTVTYLYHDLGYSRM